MPTIRIKKTQSQRKRESASPTDVPPIFFDVPTTRAMAALGGVGPCTIKMLTEIFGRAKKSQVIQGLKRMERLGLVYAFDIPFMKGVPRVYALNRGHVAHTPIHFLCVALWRSSAQYKAKKIIKTPYWLPHAYRTTALRGGEQIWSRGSSMGGILHLLAEIDDEAPLIVLSKLLNSKSFMGVRLDRLTGFGLITERYDHPYRLVQLNKAHPLYLRLKRYLRWVNKTHLPKYVRLAKQFATDKANGNNEWAWREKYRVIKARGRRP